MKILIESVFNGVNYSTIFSTTLNDYRKIHFLECLNNNIEIIDQGNRKLLYEDQLEEFNRNKKVVIDVNIEIETRNDVIYIRAKFKNNYWLTLFSILLIRNELFVSKIEKVFTNFEDLNEFLYDNLNFKISKKVEDEFYSDNMLSKFIE